MPANIARVADGPTKFIHDTMFNVAYDAINAATTGVYNVLETGNGGAADPTGTNDCWSILAAKDAATAAVASRGQCRAPTASPRAARLPMLSAWNPARSSAWIPASRSP